MPEDGIRAKKARRTGGEPWGQIGQVDEDVSIKPMMGHGVPKPCRVGLLSRDKRGLRSLHSIFCCGVAERGAWARKNSHDERQKGLLGKQGKRERANYFSWE
jgi:hypothetical protein